MTLATVFLLFGAPKLPAADETPSAQEESAPPVATAAANENATESEKSPPPDEKNPAALPDEFVTLLGAGREKYSVFLAYPKSDRVYIWQSRPMHAADMIKPFILAAAYDAQNKGKLSPETIIILTDEMKTGGAGTLQYENADTSWTIDELCEMMITDDDDTATNILIDFIGMKEINDFFAAQGFSDTKLLQKMSAKPSAQDNLTSVRDLGAFFRRLYDGKLLDAEHDRRMTALLLAQRDKAGFPAALPDANIAHKSGALANLYDDGGIVYTRRGDFILCIMDDGINDMPSHMTRLQNFASLAEKSLPDDK